MATTEVQTTEQKNELTPAEQKKKKTKELMAWIQSDSIKGSLADACNKVMTPERLAKVVCLMLSTQPQLADCTKESIFLCMQTSAQLGLEPGPLARISYIPRWSGTRKCLEASPLIGYQGYVELARRSGEILAVKADIVCENDLFVYEEGLETTFRHAPCLKGPRGEMYLAYCLVKFTNGGHHIEIKRKDEIDATMRQALANKKNKADSPWTNYYDEMAKKTAVRAASKYMPLTTELMRAIALDDAEFAGDAKPGEQFNRKPSKAADILDNALGLKKLASEPEAEFPTDHVGGEGEVIDVETEQSNEAESAKAKATFGEISVAIEAMVEPEKAETILKWIDSEGEWGNNILDHDQAETLRSSCLARKKELLAGAGGAKTKGKKGKADLLDEGAESNGQ